VQGGGVRGGVHVEEGEGRRGGSGVVVGGSGRSAIVGHGHSVGRLRRLTSRPVRHSAGSNGFKIIQI
jgi:hypothetical protein